MKRSNDWKTVHLITTFDIHPNSKTQNQKRCIYSKVLAKIKTFSIALKFKSLMIFFEYKPKAINQLNKAIKVAKPPKNNSMINWMINSIKSYRCLGSRLNSLFQSSESKKLIKALAKMNEKLDTGFLDIDLKDY